MLLLRKILLLEFLSVSIAAFATPQQPVPPDPAPENQPAPPAPQVPPSIGPDGQPLPPVAEPPADEADDEAQSDQESETVRPGPPQP